MATGRLGKTALASGAVGAQVIAGGAVASSPGLATAGAIGLAGVVLAVVFPVVALVAVLPSSVGYWRVGPASFNISFADVALAGAIVASLPFVPWQSPRLRSYGRLLLVYLGVIGIPVIAALSERTILEWGHRAFLVGGALVVGAAIQSAGHTRAALRAYVATGVVMAVAAVLNSAAHAPVNGLPAPGYPFGLQKNPAGLLIGFAVLILLVSPRLVSLAPPVRSVSLIVLFTGVLACQSRGTAVALVVVLLVWLVRTGRIARSPLMAVGLVVLVGMTYLSFSALFQSDDADSRFNSVNSRLDTYEAAMDLWDDNPLVGAGLKYWRDGTLASGVDGSFGEPHNVVISALGESGIIGLAGLVILVIGATRLLGRGRDELVMLAGAALWAKTLASVFDIFWVAGTMTVPWILIGMVCANQDEKVDESASEMEGHEDLLRHPLPTPSR